jgi:hypothetical protein
MSTLLVRKLGAGVHRLGEGVVSMFNTRAALMNAMSVDVQAAGDAAHLGLVPTAPSVEAEAAPRRTRAGSPPPRGRATAATGAVRGGASVPEAVAEGKEEEEEEEDGGEPAASGAPSQRRAPPRAPPRHGRQPTPMAPPVLGGAGVADVAGAVPSVLPEGDDADDADDDEDHAAAAARSGAAAVEDLEIALHSEA